jgi:hypothetical protein
MAYTSFCALDPVQLVARAMILAEYDDYYRGWLHNLCRSMSIMVAMVALADQRLCLAGRKKASNPRRSARTGCSAVDASITALRSSNRQQEQRITQDRLCSRAFSSAKIARDTDDASSAQRHR